MGVCDELKMAGYDLYQTRERKIFEIQKMQNEVSKINELLIANEKQILKVAKLTKEDS